MLCSSARGLELLESRLLLSDSSPAALQAADAPNQPPTATVSLSSHSPTTADYLTATATAADPDGDPVWLTFVWRVNGVVKAAYASVESRTSQYGTWGEGFGDEGDTITVEVIPNDGAVAGASAADSATVANSAPWVSDISVEMHAGLILSLDPADFTSHFSDADGGDTLQEVRITALPHSGILRLAGVAVAAGDEIPAAALGQLTYVPCVAGPDETTDRFTWVGTDGDLDSWGTAGFTITVRANLFDSASTYTTGGGSARVQTADFNGDGILDLVTADSGGWYSYAAGTLSVLLGHGDGTFAPAVQYDSLPNAVALGVGDFTGDGRLDLIVAGGDSYDQGDRIGLLSGRGDGTFDAYVSLAGPSDITDLALGDVDGDGKPDIVALRRVSTYPWSYTSAYCLDVWRSNGDGTGFSSSSIVDSALAMVAGDFDRDGKLDLAIGRSTCQDYYGDRTNYRVSIYHGEGEGTFTLGAEYANGDGVDGLLAADLDADGNMDLVAWRGSNGSDRVVSTLLGNGDGTFSPGMDYTSAGVIVGAVAVDADADGDLDLAVAEGGSGRVALLVGRGDGGFSTEVLSSQGSCFTSVATGDFNGDGRPDLAAPDLGYYSSTSTLHVLLNVHVAVPWAMVSASVPQGNISVDYILQDSAATSSDVLIQYSLDGGQIWQAATAAAGSEGTTGLAASPTGVAHRFVWDSVSDTGAQTIAAVLIRIIPASATGRPVMTNAFRLKNAPNTLPQATVSLDQHSTSPFAAITASATKEDVDGDPVSLTFTWKAGNTVVRTFTSDAATSDSFDLNTISGSLRNYTLIVEVTPYDGLTAGTTAADSANVTDVPPSDFGLSYGEVTENQQGEVWVGSFEQIVDPDGGGNYVWELVDGEGAQDNGGFRIQGDELRATVAFDYETKPTCSVRVRMSDGPYSVEKVFTIVVENVNEAPTAPTLSGDTVDENQPAGTVVGYLSATDADAGDTVAFRVAYWSEYYWAFEVVGNELRTTMAFDYEMRNTYVLQIEAFDSNWASSYQTVTVHIGDIQGTVHPLESGETFTTRNAEGAALNVRLDGPGSGQVHLNDDGYSIAQIDLTGTTEKSVLTITPSKSYGTARVNTINLLDGQLGAIVAPNVDLAGQGLIGSADSYVRRIRLRDIANGADLLLPGAAPSGRMTITARVVEPDAQITLGMPVRLARFASVDGGSLTAPQIDKLRVTADRSSSGDFQAALTLGGPGVTRALGSAAVAGWIYAGTWSITGDIGSITAGGAGAGWARWTLHAQGAVGALRVRGSLHADVQARSIGSIRVGGDVDSTTVSLGGSEETAGQEVLGSLHVRGSIWNSTLIGQGDFGTISTGRLEHSNVLAGVGPAEEPWTTGQLPSSNTIRSLRVRGQGEWDTAFSNSHIAAGRIGALAITAPDRYCASTVTAHSVGIFSKKELLDGKRHTQTWWELAQSGVPGTLIDGIALQIV